MQYVDNLNLTGINYCYYDRITNSHNHIFWWYSYWLKCLLFYVVELVHCLQINAFSACCWWGSGWVQRYLWCMIIIRSVPVAVVSAAVAAAADNDNSGRRYLSRTKITTYCTRSPILKFINSFAIRSVCVCFRSIRVQFTSQAIFQRTAINDFGLQDITRSHGSARVL